MFLCISEAPHYPTSRNNILIFHHLSARLRVLEGSQEFLKALSSSHKFPSAPEWTCLESSIMQIVEGILQADLNTLVITEAANEMSTVTLHNSGEYLETLAADLQ